MSIISIDHQRGLKIADCFFETPNSSPHCDILRLRQVPACLSEKGWTCGEFHTLFIDLTHDEEALLKQMHSNTRYEIRRAISKDNFDCQIEYHPFPDQVEQFQSFFNQYMQHRGLVAPSKEFIQHLSAHNSFAMSWVKHLDYNILAYHTYVLGLKRARLLNSVTFQPEENKKIRTLVGRANRLLHWQDMLTFQEHDIECYDFGGVALNTESPELLGINEFKRSFGGDLVTEYNCVKAISWKGAIALRFILATPRFRSKLL